MNRHKIIILFVVTAHLLLECWVIMVVGRDPINVAKLIGWLGFMIMGALPIFSLLIYIFSSKSTAKGGQLLLYSSILISTYFAIGTIYSPFDLAAFGFAAAVFSPWIVTFIGLILYAVYKLSLSVKKIITSPSVKSSS